jgi:predicted nucleic acid-binding protein
LSAYDAAYLELALRNAASIATLDDKLVVAARSSGAGIWQPEN